MESEIEDGRELLKHRTIATCHQLPTRRACGHETEYVRVLTLSRLAFGGYGPRLTYSNLLRGMAEPAISCAY